MATALSSRRRAGVGEALAILLLCGGLGSCASSDSLEHQIALLDSADTREQAIEQLLLEVEQAPEAKHDAVAERVLFALMEAYREDHERPQLVAALALLEDRRAAGVLASAVKDFSRGGRYRRAAVKAARALGHLHAREGVPALLSALEAARKAKLRTQLRWLEQAIIRALERIGDPRAVPQLIEALEGDPLDQPVSINRLAALALGRLGGKRTARPLVAALGSPTHGRLLRTPARRALCRLGRVAVAPLRAAARAGGSSAGAAVSALADLGAKSELAELAGAGQPAKAGLELGVALARLGDARGTTLLVGLVGDDARPYVERARAAAQLGWYAEPEAVEQLLEQLEESGSGPRDVLRWPLALAVSRLGGKAALERFDRYRERTQDRATRLALATYRRRLTMVTSCRDDAACLRRKLGDADWRIRERAALELSRKRGSAAVSSLVPLLEDRHPQVRRAVLVSFERLLGAGSTTPAEGASEAPSVGRKVRAAIVGGLLSLVKSEDKAQRKSTEALRAHALCLALRLKREVGTR